MEKLIILNLLTENLLGFFIGITSSFLVWFLTSKVISPKIIFSENISKTEPSYAKYPVYKFRIRNMADEIL